MATIEIAIDKFTADSDKFLALVNKGTNTSTLEKEKGMEIDDDTYFASPQVIRHLDQSIAQAKAGNVIRLETEQELKDFFDSL
jgi:hypothetical protein